MMISENNNLIAALLYVRYRYLHIIKDDISKEELHEEISNLITRVIECYNDKLIPLEFITNLITLVNMDLLL